MSHELTKEQLSNINTFASGTANLDCSKPEARYHNEQYQNTPLWIRGNTTDGFYITIGDYRVTDTLSTVQDCKNLIKRRDLNLLITIMSAVVETHNIQEDVNKSVNEINNKQAPEGNINEE